MLQECYWQVSRTFLVDRMTDASLHLLHACPQVNRGQWGCLAGAPLGALAQLLQDWLGGFREPVLTGAALHAVLRLGSALTEARALLLRADSNAARFFQPNLPNQCSQCIYCIILCSPLTCPLLETRASFCLAFRLVHRICKSPVACAVLFRRVPSYNPDK